MHGGTVSNTQASARQRPVALVVMTRMFLVIASVAWGPESSELRNTDLKGINDMAHGYVRKFVPGKHNI